MCRFCNQRGPVSLRCVFDKNSPTVWQCTAITTFSAEYFPVLFSHITAHTLTLTSPDISLGSNVSLNLDSVRISNELCLICSITGPANSSNCSESLTGGIAISY